MALTTRLAHSSNDFEPLLASAREFIRFIDRPDIFPDPEGEGVAKMLNGLLWLPNFHVIVAERDGEYAGAVGFLINPFAMNPDKLEFHESFWWAKGQDPRAAVALLRAARRMGEDHGVTVWTLNAIGKSPPAVAKAYRKVFGATMIQTTYMGTS